MSVNDEIYCPHCKSTSYVRLHPSGSEYAALVIREVGSVYPNVCLNCGTVYLDRHYLETIRKEKERKQNCGTVYLDRHYLETIRKEKERKQKIMKW